MQVALVAAFEKLKQSTVETLAVAAKIITAQQRDGTRPMGEPFAKNCGHGTVNGPSFAKQIGREIAEWTAKQIGDTGKVALILGPPGAPTFRNLAAGYMETLEKHPKMSVAFRTDGALTRERGLHNAEDALIAHPDLKAIYAANDDVALGAMQAVIAAGKQKDVLVTGMNGVPPALKSIKDGNLAMTVELNPFQWGSLGVDVMKAFLDGAPPKTQTFVPHKLIDKANIDETMKPQGGGK